MQNVVKDECFIEKKISTAKRKKRKKIEYFPLLAVKREKWITTVNKYEIFWIKKKHYKRFLLKKLSFVLKF